MKWHTAFTCSLVGLAAAVVGLLVTPWKAETGNLERSTLSESASTVGRLAEFPATARNVSLRPLEAADDSRHALSGSFFDSRENIVRWLQASPGVRQGQRVGQERYFLRTGSGVPIGEVMILPGAMSKVVFRLWAS